MTFFPNKNIMPYYREEFGEHNYPSCVTSTHVTISVS